MQKSKLVYLSNLSNEANMCQARTTTLYQLNVGVLIGVDYLRESALAKQKIPLAITIDKMGDLTIEGIDGITINDEHLRMHSDRKITDSEE
ncbi:MAG TPA: hypothetical protein VFC74_10860 [Oscillospiraceae bacterium]|nr:hypothetical protein [Oscillospiraceae bacterium]